MKRAALLERLTPFKSQRDIELAIETLNESDSDDLTNDEIHSVWHWVSKSLDHEFSDDENHPTWQLELELSQAYKREQFVKSDVSQLKDAPIGESVASNAAFKFDLKQDNEA